MSDRFKVLIPTDFSDCARNALAHALYLTKRYDGEIHLLHAVELPTIAVTDMPPDMFDIEEERALERMEDLLEEHAVHQARTSRVHTAVRPGKPTEPAAEVILDYAEDAEIDMIVMGTHGRRGARRLLLGSVAEQVIRGAECPVFAVRETEKAWPLPSVDTILVPVDFSAGTDDVINEAIDLAGHYDAAIRLLHVVDIDTYPHYGIAVDPVIELAEKTAQAARKELEKIADRITVGHLAVFVSVERGHAASTISEYAVDCDVDLIVLGSHGRSGLDRLLLGSVAEKTLRMAHCPVVVVR
ncbi:MAG: universal stress protein, partial [Rhodothermales bacterium]|nr:universal stress protein [Rhodothermales bacterium]